MLRGEIGGRIRHGSLTFHSSVRKEDVLALMRHVILNRHVQTAFHPTASGVWCSLMILSPRICRLTCTSVNDLAAKPRKKHSNGKLTHEQQRITGEVCSPIIIIVVVFLLHSRTV
jgi:hypothetical protein